MPAQKSAVEDLLTALVKVTWWTTKTTVKTAVFTLRWAVTHPRTTTAASVVGSAGWLAGVETAAAVVVTPPVIALLWRGAHPSSFREYAGPHLSAWWRRWTRYALAWPRWAARCRLSVRVEGADPEVPKLLKVTVTPAADLLLVKVPVGLDLDAFRRVTDALCAAAKARGCRILEHSRPGHAVVEFQRRDVLANTIAALPIPTPLPEQKTLWLSTLPARGKQWGVSLLRLVPGVDVTDYTDDDVEDQVPVDPRSLAERLRVNLAAVPVGIREDGSPWELPILARHILVGGKSRSGKGSLIWSVMRHLAPAIAAGLVEVTGIDPKGGLELEIGRAMFTRYEADDFGAMADLIEHEAADAHQRALALRGGMRKFTPSLAHPLRLLIVDELATLTAYAPMQIRSRVETAMGLLLTKGAAPGFSMLGLVQEPSKDIIPMRGLFTYRIALAVDTPAQVDMLLGDGMRDRGAFADRIPLSTPGVGYAKDDVLRDPFRVRAAYVTDEEIRAMAQAYPAPGVTPAALDNQPAKQVPVVKPVNGTLLPDSLLDVLNKAAQPGPDDATDGAA
ncbi:hypothetical protein AB0M43_30765 [Longispora sp. NPDC051575]|uniref:hypothetical protein n=1 Tax=Longispora sp. NPDC051575 TaxID=3154943 RepID=UPI003424BCF0